MVMSLRHAYGEGHTSLRQAARTVVVGQPSLAPISRAFVEIRRHEERIVTRTALGGGFRLELSHDGRFHFSGSVRATGWPSFRVSLAVALHVARVDRTGVGQPGVIVFSAHGQARGSNRAGERTYTWAENDHCPAIQAHWAEVRTGRVTRDFQYSTDAVGVAGDVLGVLGQLAAMNLVFGSAGAGLVMAGRAADALGVEKFALPGIVGVVVAGGAVMFLGPGAAYPAFWIGAGTAAAGVRQRHLRDDERGFCDRAFGPGRIDWSRVVLTNLLGLESRPCCVPSPGGPILVNIGPHAYEHPLAYGGYGSAPHRNDLPGGRMLLHELTHVWQIQHHRFTPGFYCRAVAASAGDEYAYADTPWRPFTEWGSDQQAEIVADWFAGGNGPMQADQRRLGPQRWWGPRDTGSPWYPAIAGALRGGVVS